jgi:hypothetical protein
MLPPLTVGLRHNLTAALSLLFKVPHSKGLDSVGL